ncbi:MAG: hypothetical protein NC299_12710 [Lachnospiraceae bacterium]|nr:hypothetical protein [Ruminococcus sp.]MCM1276201.1 hypothetical protein [Lachnospiraceae bacterium]
MEIINEASGKFKDKQNELCGFLFDILRQLNELEAEVNARSEELKKQRPEPHIIAPGEEELWDEYERRTGEIVRPVCTEKLLKRRYGGEFGNPSKYAYVDGDCKAVFSMKSAGKAVVVVYFTKGTPQMHKFVLKSADGGWLLDEMYYGFQSSPDKWYAYSIR